MSRNFRRERRQRRRSKNGRKKTKFINVSRGGIRL